VTQEVLVKVITRLSTFRGESAFRTWLYRIVVNEIINLKKRHPLESASRPFESFTRGLDDSGDALVAWDQRERRPQLRAADEQKVVFVQRRELDSDLDLEGTRRRRLLSIDDAHDVLCSSELPDLDGTHVDSL